ncbi:N-6 DNA methylase [Pseudomonas synxantha]|uniref:Eco57I restriction-modification methylase domain-containing protein n=1 Tax=Pseudomonas synxantha TaxID=47883 RepID=UPI0023689FCC|nr:N-6 DNA methylase [Pseudomonas synxantha]WDG41918.1 N-6 DNA methylase [Pseudomonas synxantha]
MKPLLKLQNLIEKYRSNLVHYQSSRYNETQLRTDFLDQLFSILGWDITNTNRKTTNEREVLVEEGLRLRAGDNTKKPDYTFRLFSERKFFVEAKKPSVQIHVDAESAQQVRRYGFTAKLKISVLTNFEHTIIYDCSNPVSKNDSATNSRIKIYHYTELLEKFEEIRLLIGRESVYSGEFDKKWLDIESQIAKFSVDDLFLKQINSWRLILANEFISIKPELNEEELNDLTQSYINSIVFLRVCEDRDLEDYETLYQLAKIKDFKSLAQKIKSSDKKYNSGLFALSHISDLINNVDSCIWTIIEELYFPQSPYSFSVFSSEILGNIYEIFLSEKIQICTDGKITLQPKKDHIDRDVVTTPGHIVRDIIRNSVVIFCKGKTDKQILDSKFADIACGSGAFLLELFQVLQDIFIDYYIIHDKSKLQQITPHSFKLKLSLKKEILTRCIYGVDKDFNAVKACSFGLLLKLLEGESKDTINFNTPILPKIDNNIQFGNSLIDPHDNINISDAVTINPFKIEHKFDVIIGNPPYMATEHMKQLTPLELPIYKNKYKSAYKQFDKYFLFVERSIQLLKDEGSLGYILPSKFTKVGAGQGLRKLLTEQKYLSKLISFGSSQVFKNKTTYTCLLFLTKSKQTHFEFYEVKDYRKWLTREESFADTTRYDIDELDSDTWILEKETTEILQRMYSKSELLGEILGKKSIANGIQTSANEFYVHKEIKSENGDIYFTYKGRTHCVEKELTRPYFETRRSDDEKFYTYKDVEPNAFVIYPYVKANETIQLVKYEDLKIRYPKTFNFLETLKVYLDNGKRSIKPDPTTPNEWYRYGRSQGLENCDVPKKLIVGVLSNGHKYSIDENQTFVSSGGTAGYSIINVPSSCKYSIYYIQAILSSKYLEWFASIYGEVFRGGFVARGTKIQTRMPIPKIDFDDAIQKASHDKIADLQSEMNKLYAEISKSTERTKIIMQRQFEIMSEQMDLLIKKLFDLGDMDKYIPSIKEIYRSL